MPSVGSSHLDAFPLILGTNGFGWTASPAASRAILDAFVAGGGNVIDTADAYSFWVPQRPEGCAAVSRAYRRWASAIAVDEPLAFGDYKAATDRQEGEATLYTRLMRRAGHLGEVGLAHRLAQIETSYGTW